MNPSIKLEIDPHRIVPLTASHDIRAGGVRMKTTIYVVEEPDIPGATRMDVTTVTVPANAVVELRIAE